MAAAKKKAATKAPDKAARASWRNRIIAFAQVDPATLKANPLNWRMHPESQKRAMSDVFAQVGFVEAIIVNKTTGHILDGHMRHQLALEHREQTVPVLYVDMTAEEEKLSLTILNPMAELATTDPEKLAELLADLPRLGGALDELLGSLDELAGGAMVKDTNTGGAGAKRSPIKHAAHALRMMLAVTDVAVVERAIARTGNANRGEALMTICREYLSEHEADDDAEGQLDSGAQGSLADQLEKAAQGLAGHS
jgi:hypothetical protein